MSNPLKKTARNSIKTAVALLPWIVAMYVFYWLDSSGTWTSDTPHRGKFSVAILAAGMALSFLVKSRFDK